MNGLEAAHALVVEIKGHLTAAGITAVHVTVDAKQVPSALASKPVVLVQPPTLTHETYTYTIAAWETVVMAGPPGDLLAAWAKINPITTALREPLSVDSETPATFQHPSMPDHPAYALEFTTEI